MEIDIIKSIIMKTIRKIQFETTSIQDVEMPKNCTILSLQSQNNKPCLWYLFNRGDKLIKRTIEIFGTNYDIPSDYRRKYLGTFQTYSGFVGHVFERLEKFDS